MRYVHRFIPVLALLFTLAATSYAQSARRTVILIPFDFVAGEKVLPAGTYRVGPVRRDSYTAWEIRSTRVGGGAVVMTSAIAGGAAEAEPRLVFRKYEETYVLAELWPSTDSAGREVFRPRRGSASAARNVKPEAVAVLAHAR